MQSPAPAHGKYALRTGRLLDRPPAVLEFSRLGAEPPREIEEVGAEDLVEDVDDVVATPAPPVIPRIVRTTQVEGPPPARNHAPPARNHARTRARGPSLFSMFATVILLAGIGATAGFAMRALAQAPVLGATAAISGGGFGAPGDRETRDRHAPRISAAPIVPPSLAAPPSPEATQTRAVAAAAVPRVTKAQPAAHAARAPHAPRHPPAAPAARSAKKRAAHDH